MLVAIIVSMIVGAVTGIVGISLFSAGSVNEYLKKIDELELANEKLRGLLKEAYREMAENEEKTKTD